MPNPFTEGRRQAYFKLSADIAQLDNEQLRALLGQNASKAPGSGWGANQTLTFDQSKVFVKRVPVTDLEYGHLFSTKNLYHLPTYCNYGLVSIGFNIFRELLTHIKTTQWVLAGEIATFPLMYHYRIIPFSGPQTGLDRAQLRTYVERWGNNKNVGKYAVDRANANHELVLFLEYIPHILGTWLAEHPSQLQQLWNDLCTTIDFLRTKRIVHFDAHFHNVLTDGKQTYLTDFGLVLDQNFALTQEEELFLERHELYDYGEICRNLGLLMRLNYDTCSEQDKDKITEKYNIDPFLKAYEVTEILLENIEQIHADCDLNLDTFYVEAVVKYRPIIALSQAFFVEMWGNSKKDTLYPQSQLRLLLQEAGVLPETKNPS
jgi:hypothetical protein